MYVCMHVLTMCSLHVSTLITLYLRVRQIRLEVEEPHSEFRTDPTCRALFAVSTSAFQGKHFSVNHRPGGYKACRGFGFRFGRVGVGARVLRVEG